MSVVSHTYKGLNQHLWIFDVCQGTWNQSPVGSQGWMTTNFLESELDLNVKS